MVCSSKNEVIWLLNKCVYDMSVALLPVLTMYEYRCDERLKVKVEGSTRLASVTVLRGGLEHLNIETSLIDERFASEMGECVI
jgi:hypothetical protein